MKKTETLKIEYIDKNTKFLYQYPMKKNML